MAAPFIKSSTNVVAPNSKSTLTQNYLNFEQKKLSKKTENNATIHKNTTSDINHSTDYIKIEKSSQLNNEFSKVKKSCLCKKSLQNNNGDYFTNMKKLLINNLTEKNKINTFIQENISENRIANIEDTDEKIRDADAVFL